MTKQEIYRRNFSQLEDGINCLIFFKKDSTLRIMLATRDIITAGMCLSDSLSHKLNKHSERCNCSNGNIAVIDLLLGDVRSFSVDRLVRNIYLGECSNLKEFENFVVQYNNIRKQFDNVNQVLNLDNLDVENKIRSIAENIRVNCDNTEQDKNTYQSTDVSKYISAEELKV